MEIIIFDKGKPLLDIADKQGFGNLQVLYTWNNDIRHPAKRSFASDVDTKKDGTVQSMCSANGDSSDLCRSLLLRIEELNTGVLLLTRDLKSIAELNPAAVKILGWQLETLNDNIADLSTLSLGLAAFAKVLKSLKTGFYELETGSCKRIEVQINSQYYNLYLQTTEQGYLIELTQIIYQDMNQSTHELKRPIQNIKTLVESLLLGAKDDPLRCKDYLAKLNHEADRLGTMVQDMLSLSHVLSGSVELNKIEFDLANQVEKLIALAQSRAAAKNIEISMEIESGILINADRKFFDHLLANLIDNAIKYNHEGGRVLVSYQDGILTVSDTGRGIPEQDLIRVFEQFYRVKASQEIQGTGLGLAIVKAIVELHGWQITIDSELGTGTSFKIAII